LFQEAFEASDRISRYSRAKGNPEFRSTQSEEIPHSESCPVILTSMASFDVIEKGVNILHEDFLDIGYLSTDQLMKLPVHRELAIDLSTYLASQLLIHLSPYLSS
jgi:hypothetical protein